MKLLTNTVPQPLKMLGLFYPLDYGFHRASAKPQPSRKFGGCAPTREIDATRRGALVPAAQPDSLTARPEQA